jgi:hypothetical protein
LGEKLSVRVFFEIQERHVVGCFNFVRVVFVTVFVVTLNFVDCDFVDEEYPLLRSVLVFFYGFNRSVKGNKVCVKRVILVCEEVDFIYFVPLGETDTLPVRVLPACFGRVFESFYELLERFGSYTSDCHVHL